MYFSLWQSKLLQLWKQRNAYLVLAAGLLLINFLQSIALLCLVDRWHTMIVPAPLSRTVWLNQSTVSDSYLAEMTDYFSTLILDSTPDNAKFQHDTLLRYVEPSSYGHLKNQLLLNEETLKTKNISTSFFPIDIKTDRKHFTCLITGDLKTFVGQELTSTLRQSYLVRYHYAHGRLLLQQFDEVKKDVP
jgi:type IV conjugative transfer system protein TraE